MNIITIPGIPRPLARPRFNNGHVYDSQKDLKETYIFHIKSQYKGPLLQGPLSLYANFFFQEKPIRRTRIPKSQEPLERTSKDKDSLKWVPLPKKPHLSVPDLSNLVKLIEDVCIGIIYPDDKSIVYINASKYYHHTSMTLFTILPFTESQCLNTLNINAPSKEMP